MQPKRDRTMPSQPKWDVFNDRALSAPQEPPVTGKIVRLASRAA